MNEFNLSDKELKALLQNEGLDEPSLSFNRNILEHIKAEEKRSTLHVPAWVKIAFIVLVISPLAYAAFAGADIDLGIESLNQFQIPALSFNLSSTYQYLSLLVVGVVWMAFIFNRFLSQHNQPRVKKG